MERKHRKESPNARDECYRGQNVARNRSTHPSLHRLRAEWAEITAAACLHWTGPLLSGPLYFPRVSVEFELSRFLPSGRWVSIVLEGCHNGWLNSLCAHPWVDGYGDLSSGFTAISGRNCMVAKRMCTDTCIISIVWVHNSDGHLWREVHRWSDCVATGSLFVSYFLFPFNIWVFSILLLSL